MMYQTLLDVEQEAKKFLKIVESTRAAHAAMLANSGLDMDYLFVSGKTSGALRRSSMDLTRKLADLRQNR
jgi:hypothetical protein